MNTTTTTKMNMNMNIISVGNYLIHIKSEADKFHSGVHKLSQEAVSVNIIDKMDQKEMARVAREVKAQVAGKNISSMIKLKEVFHDEKRYFVIYESFTDGNSCTLYDFIKQFGKLDENNARKIFQQVAECLASLHNVGIVHGDLKLPNVIIQGNVEKLKNAARFETRIFEEMKKNNTVHTNHVTLSNNNSLKTKFRDEMDFEMDAGAKIVNPFEVCKGDITLKIRDFSESTILSDPTEQIRGHKGSPGYLAPEVTMTQQPFDGKKADCYALGVIGYALLVGAYPLTAPSFLELVEKIRYSSVEFPASLSPNAVGLFQRLLEKSPNKRLPATAVLRHPWITEIDEQIVPETEASRSLGCSQAYYPVCCSIGVSERSAQTAC